MQFVAIAAAVFFIVKPVTAMMNRLSREPIEEGMPDEERRHRELLTALGQLSRYRDGGGGSDGSALGSIRTRG